MAKLTWNKVGRTAANGLIEGGHAIKDTFAGTPEAASHVGGALNTGALHVANAGANVVNWTGKLANTKLGKAAIAVTATVAAAAGVKSWHDKRVARKNEEAAMASPEAQNLQEQLAANKRALAEVSERMGQNNPVSGNLAQNVLSGRGAGQSLPNTSQPTPS